MFIWAALSRMPPIRFCHSILFFCAVGNFSIAFPLFPAVLLSVFGFILACFSSHFADFATAFVFARWTPYSCTVHVIDWGFLILEGCEDLAMETKANEQGSFSHIRLRLRVLFWKSYICYRATGPGTERVDWRREDYVKPEIEQGGQAAIIRIVRSAQLAIWWIQMIGRWTSQSRSANQYQVITYSISKNFHSIISEIYL